MTLPDRRKRGRPAYKPTPAVRHSVAVRAAAGVTQEHIALALGIDADTLRKHFAHELTLGAQQRRQEMLDCMFKAGKKGNVTAQKAFVAICDKAQDRVITTHPAFAEPVAPKPEKKGKKQQQQEDATTAQIGTDWHDLLTPARPQ